MTPLRIALYQGPSGVPTSTADSLTALADAARRAAAAGARLLLTNELYLTGYALGSAVRDLAEPADGPAARAVAAIAAEHGLAVGFGYPERDGEAVFNSLQIVGPDGGLLANYRKAHLFGDYETTFFTPGDQAVVQADLDGVRLGLLICYDVEFPEAVRAHALAGTELLLVPTALMRPYEIVPQTIVPARAWESQLYIAYANRCGDEGDFAFAGLSCLAAPDGTVRARAGAGEDLIVADVDPGLLKASRAENTYLSDRRPELYGSLT
ncbi:carbon-nitrogen hydrolase family protein [Streptomyces triculaminicus]|uniref:Carbon-nitrogen hydrolase family protein n=3 Tax=Streptomyces TaxID=1883 RepID=A0A939FN21_9ACTN|nr:MULTISPECIES: carbon-nitrogen hydrolase family protein [Streptomyces]MBO0653538.1 carbon-nitrogen hydrolase family protein [Streptomyces triculaminicus]QSY48389.1 carbon-nitrogen hydrolase family protein [Streptomyces griseocarneus]